MIIKIDINNKLPVVEKDPVMGDPIIVCNNTNYQIQFTFDEEWDAHETKTARFIWQRGDDKHFADAPFTGDTVDMPILQEVRWVSVGVYAGDLHTTAPAKIKCVYSVLCDSEESTQEWPKEITKAVLNLPQEFSEEEQAQIRENICAQSKEDAQKYKTEVDEKLQDINIALGDKAESTHSHDDEYADKSHSHDDKYAAKDHSHSEYANKTQVRIHRWGSDD